MKRLTVVVAWFCCLMCGAPVTAERSLLVVTEAVCYSNPEFETVGLIEFPLMINRAQLEFFRPDTVDPNFYARVFAQAVVYDTSGAAVDSNSTYFSARVATLDEGRAKSRMLFNKLAVLVPPGAYSARVLVIDAASKRSFETLIDDIVVPPLESTRLTIGGPTLAYQVSQVDTGMTGINERMVKSGLYILNAPAGLFAETDTVAFLYAELYGLRPGENTTSQFHTSVQVSDAAGTFSRDLGWKKALKPGGPAAVTQSIDISNWPAGRYLVKLTAVDPSVSDTVSTTTSLRILPTLDTTAIEDETSAANPYDSLTLKEKIELVTYTLTPPQMATLKKLSDVGKETFLDQYWRGVDEYPTTERIENRDELVRRYQYANKNFSRFLTEKTGWQTDMGRIYMKYGPWDQRQDIPAPRVGKPFAIWYYYEIKEGYVFVFEDPFGNRDYKLVHSNAKGERYDAAWAARLREEMLDIK